MIVVTYIRGVFLEDKIKLHKEICDEARELYNRKNRDYGDSFSKSYDDFGPIAGVVRISDKVERLKSLVRSKDVFVSDENFEDTLVDNINYFVMLLMELRNDGK